MVNIFSRWNFQDVKSHQDDKNKTLIIRYLDLNIKGKQISSIKVNPEDITAKTQVMQINGINHDLNYDNVVSIEFAGKNKGDSSVISRRNLELKNDGKQQSNAITYGALVATNLSLWIVCIAIKLNDIPHNDIAYSVALFVFIVSIIYAIIVRLNKNSPQKDIDYYQDMFEKKEENEQNPIRSTIRKATKDLVIDYDDVERCEFVDRVNLFFRGKGSSQEYVKLRIEELDKQKKIYQDTDKSFVSKLKSRITPASQNRI